MEEAAVVSLCGCASRTRGKKKKVTDCWNLFFFFFFTFKLLPCAELPLPCAEETHKHMKWSGVSQLSQSHRKSNTMLRLCVACSSRWTHFRLSYLGRGGDTSEGSAATNTPRMASIALTSGKLMWLRYTILNTLTLRLYILDVSAIKSSIRVLCGDSLPFCEKWIYYIPQWWS